MCNEYLEMKAQRVDLDRISTLPPPIIEDILCRLNSIQEAAKTSILSREWRYKWTKIPKLVFHEFHFKNPTDGFWSREPNDDEARKIKTMAKRYKIFYAIYQVLLLHEGPIHEFGLTMELDKRCVDIDNIISHLSRNHVVEKLLLNLDDEDREFYLVPLSIFSLHKLMDLYLFGCDLNHPPTFNGFSSLTTLYLKEVYITSKSLLHLLSNCPLLKTFTLLLHDETIICEDNYTAIELFKCLPMIEHLTTWSWILECFSIDSVPQKPPTSLIHLKYLSFDYMSTSHRDGLYLLALLIGCSPNLEKIFIEMTTKNFCEEINTILLKPLSNIQLERLNELEIFGFGNMKPDLEFVKFILAKSPNLKKVCLHLDNALDKNEKSKMLTILLGTPPASSLVKIIVGC